MRGTSGSARALEALHLALPPSGRLMRILGPIVFHRPRSCRWSMPRSRVAARWRARATPGSREYRRSARAGGWRSCAAAYAATRAWRFPRDSWRVHGAVELTGGHRVDRVLAGKEPDLRPRRAPPIAQQFEQLRREHHVPVPLPLALLDSQRHALAVNVGHLQVRDLGVKRLTPTPCGCKRNLAVRSWRRSQCTTIQGKAGPDDMQTGAQGPMIRIAVTPFAYDAISLPCPRSRNG